MWDLAQTQLFLTLSLFQFPFADNGNLTFLSDPTFISLSPNIYSHKEQKQLPCHTHQPSLLRSWAFLVKGVSYHASSYLFLHLINSYSSSSTRSFVNDTFAVGEGETELKIMEVLKQQVWKSAIAGLFFFFFFRLKRKWIRCPVTIIS